ncbi:hypothetical protein O3P69_007313 [Scylla paramamosain]
MITAIEEENSLKSDHEIRAEQDRINLEIMKTGEADELDLEEASKQTAIEFEDSCLEELKSFKTTHLDKVNPEVKDVKSINRALERSLVLVVKQKLGTSEEWVFPHTPWQPGETLRQVFFYKCQVRNKDGPITPGTNIVDHQWLTQDELDTRFKQSYAKSISKFLVSDR